MATEAIVAEQSSARRSSAGHSWEKPQEQKYASWAAMPMVAYLANEFPSAVEPYVMDEIGELRRRSVRVTPCSVRSAEDDSDPALELFSRETMNLLPLRWGLLLGALWVCWRQRSRLRSFAEQAWQEPGQPAGRRIRAILHIWIGAYYALRLHEKGVSHIHAHHGYCASWIAMVAARLLGVGFSLTLHGSDLLLQAGFLRTKLENCQFCLTISEFNRRNILEHFPGIDPRKIVVHRLGVAMPGASLIARTARDPATLVLFSVGRLHPVKDHAFLIRACRELRAGGIALICLIAGEGPERPRLERMIRELDLQASVKLLGHLPRQKLDAYYAACDLVVLTSRSEGIPLVLMEAMAHSKPVLAPAITGIPELVQDGRTGFLYQAGSLADFVAQIKTIQRLLPALGPMRRAARQNVLLNFNRDQNLAEFGDLFLARIMGAVEGSRVGENSVLQQIQL
jgi:colanic acid/amylovoran biosynthesis glycosyltransferase